MGTGSSVENDNEIMSSENVYVLRRATFDFVFFPETRMFELLFKKRIKSKVVLRKAVGFFEVEKVGQNCLKWGIP